MFSNYLKIAIRNLWSNRLISLLNVIGLAVGMVVSLLVGLWVMDEVGYDRFHANAPKIFRLTATVSGTEAAVTSTRMAPAVLAQLPAVKATVRLKDTQELVSIENRKFEEKQVFYADPSLLTMFSFNLIQGDPNTALSRPDGAVITQQTALKYFGKTTVLGKTIRLLSQTAEKNNWSEAVITGVLQTIPGNSHLQFDMLLPFSRYAGTERYAKNDAWDAFSLYTYLQLDEQQLALESRQRLEWQINQLYKQQQSATEAEFHLQSLTDIHLHTGTKMIQDVAGHGSIQYVEIFTIIAFVVLLIACINFINLATARASRRAKEVGVRKVVGATKTQLIQQFLGEAFLIALLALLLAILATPTLLPVFNQLTGKSLSVSLSTPFVASGMICIMLLTGVMAGSYPALFLSGFRPVQAITGKLTQSQPVTFRNALVVVQFSISIMLLIGTAIVYHQLRFIRAYNSGFDKENLLYVSLPRWGDLYNNTRALKTTLGQHAETTDFTIISDLPVNLQTGKSNFDWPGKDPHVQVIIPYLMVDANFNKVFQTKLLAGRTFRADSEADQANYLVNETALKLMKLDQSTAVGTTLSFGDNRGQIIGVVNDFNFKPLHSGIEPLVLRYNKFGGYVVVRTKPNAMAATVNRLKTVFQKLYPNHPFAYNFLDEDVVRLYRSEQRMGSLFNAFAFFSILISCLGLFGLATFTAEQRTKEIGIRKVLGASVASIVTLLSQDFLKLVLIAIVIASPIAWWAMHCWLQDFAYKITIEWWVFGLAGLLAMGIALLTVSFQSIKAALANPVKSLRSE